VQRQPDPVAQNETVAIGTVRPAGKSLE